MKKLCVRCRVPFDQGTRDFDDIRLIGVCTSCRKGLNIMEAHTLRESLKAMRAADSKLRALAASIQKGVDANVTSGPQQVSLITILRYGPCTVGEVATMIGLDQSSVTLHLKKFEADGLVETTPGSDRRQKIVKATDKAWKLYLE
jgi:DNA-binding MarR family transcriptional regulator